MANEEGVSSNFSVAAFSRSPRRKLRSVQLSTASLIQAEAVVHQLDLTNSSVCAVGLIQSTLQIPFEKQLDTILSFIESARSGILFLTPWQVSPTSGIRFDGHVYSFVCSPNLLRSVLGSEPVRVASMAYEMLHAILSRRVSVDCLIVHQLGQPVLQILQRTPKVAVVMAHRGQQSHLLCALESIRRMASRGLVKAFVGLDGDMEHYRNLRTLYPEVDFYHLPAGPLGHFYIKQSLSEICEENFVMFHDSDDVSCDNRISVTLAEMVRTKSDVVGCHELRIDELKRTIEVHRVPLDVIKALEIEQRGAQLHATTVVDRHRFLEAGGLSTDQQIASDTQFRLRAFFCLKMRNVDAFLYVRRRHAQSLTMTPGTALGCPLRTQLRHSWEAAFFAIRRGELKIEHSSLRPLRTALRVPLVRI